MRVVGDAALAHNMQVFSAYLGESESIIRDAFHRARRNQPCVLFIGEFSQGCECKCMCLFVFS